MGKYIEFSAEAVQAVNTAKQFARQVFLNVWSCVAVAAFGLLAESALATGPSNPVTVDPSTVLGIDMATVATDGILAFAAVIAVVIGFYIAIHIVKACMKWLSRFM